MPIFVFGSEGSTLVANVMAQFEFNMSCAFLVPFPFPPLLNVCLNLLCAPRYVKFRIITTFTIQDLANQILAATVFPVVFGCIASMWFSCS